MRARLAFVLAALLALPLLAGCLQADPLAAPASATGPPVPVSEALYEILPPEAVLTPMADGILLHAGVYRPSVPEGEKVPVIIDMSPYWGNSKLPALEGGNGFSQWLIDYFVPRGYAVVLASVRGTGLSEGCWNHGGALEQRDAYDLVEFYGTQSWSNGKVALIGKSYDGTTPLEAAIQNPPHLATIVPMAGLPFMYGYNYMNGVGYEIQGPLFNIYYPASVSVGPDQVLDPAPFRAATRPCAGLAAAMAEGLVTHFTGTNDAFWQERDYRALIPGIQAPVFYIHGLQDWNVKPDMIHAYNTITAPKMAWFGQWYHDYPHRGDWNTTLLTWFDHWLKGLDNGVEKLYGVHVSDNLGVWRHEAEWPPLRAVNTTLFLTEGGFAATPGSEGGAPFLSLPSTDPNPATDRTPMEAVYFEGETLTEALRVSGAPRVSLFVDSTRPLGRVATTLYEIDQNGTWHWVTRGFMDMKHRDSLDTVQPVVPGEAYNLTFDLYPLDHVFQAGSRVGFAVSSEANGWILPDGSTPTLMGLHWGGSEASALTLPVLPDATPLDPQPPMRERCDVEGNCG
ncbi:MAG TPA: CocE/NonD family hydrolase [Candidatus Thermoplasmatota archaeon]|nr:CocE/NonD family hydrolase [Candidatus Thermoplasmatota archaeon]